jgi:histidinol-phosphate/aromatic aminotransferase/cobyric acid decarboxylase-like protein
VLNPHSGGRPCSRSSLANYQTSPDGSLRGEPATAKEDKESMPSPVCRCQCKMCRASGSRHCGSRAHCGAPQRPAVPGPSGAPDEHAVAAALRELKARSGSHSPSVAELERALPGVVEIDACFLSNPYATDEAMRRLRSVSPQTLERIVSHYPSQGAAIAEMLAPSVGVAPERLVVANGACEVIQALLAHASGPLVLPLPTFSAYYEFASAPVIPLRLAPERDFELDFDELDTLIDRHAPATVVIINPNNPDGGLADHGELVDFARRARGRVKQLIVDESFGAFAAEDAPPSLAPLVAELPHLVVVNSLSKSHGIAGLRLGYAAMAPLRARTLRTRSLWNVNAFAEWFCGQLADAGYRSAYERARRRYVRETRRLFDGLAGLPAIKVYPSAANFALLELDRPAHEVAAALLARHGVYVRDCADKRGLHGDRYLRVAARREHENRRILAAFADVLSDPAHVPLLTAA